MPTEFIYNTELRDLYLSHEYYKMIDFILTHGKPKKPIVKPDLRDFNLSPESYDRISIEVKSIDNRFKISNSIKLFYITLFFVFVTEFWIVYRLDIQVLDDSSLIGISILLPFLVTAIIFMLFIYVDNKYDNFKKNQLKAFMTIIFINPPFLNMKIKNL